jgi:EAL domain-containing protein (putative c-di-GMP-specific phosphodiesterase class I)
MRGDPTLADVVTLPRRSGRGPQRDCPRLGKQVERIECLLHGKEIKVVFQAIHDLRTREVAGLEALSRFTTEPRRNPQVWFSMASAVGLGRDLELTAAAAALGFLEAIPKELFVTLNLSPSTVTSPEVHSLVASVPARRIIVEITEHAPVWDYSKLLSSVRALRREGVRVAIDDVGAGYASLQHVLELAPDFIKLDVGLIRDCQDPARLALVAALAGFARDIGADVIAEGIETERHVDTLGSLGIRFGQGYALGVPAPWPRPGDP